MNSVADLEKEILERMEAEPEKISERTYQHKFVVDPETRTIQVPGTETLFGVYSDHAAERKYFECPKIVGDNIDLSECRIYINYTSVGGTPGEYWCEDVKADGENITFSWNLTGNVFDENKDGTVAFAVHAKKADINGVYECVWNTTDAAGKTLKTIKGRASIIELYPDVIEQIISRLDNVSGVSPEQIQEAVNDYLRENPVEFKETDPNVPAWAKKPTKPTYTAEEVGALPKETKIPSKLSDMETDETHRTVTDVDKEAWNAKSNFSGNYADLQGVPETFFPSKHSHAWGDVTDKPTNFPPNTHKHTKSEITDFAHGHSWNDIDDKPEIPQVPSKLPNPYKLIMTGAVEAEYDGSKEVTVNIPQGGGSDFSGSYNDLKDKPKIPSKLSELEGDTQNRTVSDAEKNKWNAKSEFNGDYNSLTNKPDIPVALSELENDTEFVNKAGVESEVSKHNTGAESHNDIRLLISNLTSRLNALADSDDQSLDQLSEIVAYIKSNKDLIDSITTSKVGVSDIINNLTTNVANKPLSAAQGVALKALIDAIVVPTLLSQLKEDSTHRTVTDGEKSTWNSKSNFSGNYNDLSGKPTLITESKVIELINQNMPASAEGVRY